MKKLWLFLFAMLCCGYCATTGSQEESIYGQTRILQAEYEKVFQATLDYLPERGYTIKKADWESGVIETDYQAGAGVATGFTGDKRAQITCKLIKIDQNQTKLTLELFSEIRDPHSGWQYVAPEYQTARVIYDRFFEAITARAQGRKIE